jgi:hypothetical protein
MTSILVGPREPLAQWQARANQSYRALRDGIGFLPIQALRARLRSVSPSETQHSARSILGFALDIAQIE